MATILTSFPVSTHEASFMIDNLLSPALYLTQPDYPACNLYILWFIKRGVCSGLYFHCFMRNPENWCWFDASTFAFLKVFFELPRTSQRTPVKVHGIHTPIIRDNSNVLWIKFNYKSEYFYSNVHIFRILKVFK